MAQMAPDVDERSAVREPRWRDVFVARGRSWTVLVVLVCGVMCACSLSCRECRVLAERRVAQDAV